MLQYDATWHIVKQIFDICLRKIVLSCLYVFYLAKVGLLKLQDADHEQDAEQPNPTRKKLATYPGNKQTKDEIACVGLNTSLEQTLKDVGVHYSAKR